MHDAALIKDLDAIRGATVEGRITWVRMLHPIDGTVMGFKGTGAKVDDHHNACGIDAYVYMLDDTEYDDPDDPERCHSLARYPDADPLTAFDELILGSYMEPSDRDRLTKLVWLVRKVATDWRL